MEKELCCYLCGRKVYLRSVFRGFQMVPVCAFCFESFERNIVIKCLCGAVHHQERTYKNLLKFSFLRDTQYLEWALKRGSIFLMDANRCPDCAPVYGFGFSGGEGCRVDLSRWFDQIANYFTKERFTISVRPDNLRFALNYKL